MRLVMETVRIGQRGIPSPKSENMLGRFLKGLRDLFSPRIQEIEEGRGHYALRTPFFRESEETFDIDGEETTVMVMPRYIDMNLIDRLDWTRDEEGELLGKVMTSITQDSSNAMASIELPNELVGMDDDRTYHGMINSDLLPHGEGTFWFPYVVSGKWDNGILIEGSLYIDDLEYSGKFQNGIPSGGRVYRRGSSGSDFDEFGEDDIGDFNKELNEIIVEQWEDVRHWEDGSSMLMNWQEKLVSQLSKLIARIRELENSEISINELLMKDESAILEFKASLWTSYSGATGEPIEGQNKKNYSLEDSVLKTIAGFLNTNPGTLLIGIRDKARDAIKHQAEAIGIEPDFDWLKKGKQDSEGFEHSLRELMRHSFSNPSYEQIYVNISFLVVEDRQICRVDVEQIPTGDPSSALYCKTKTMGEECFFVRSGDSTISHSMQTAHEYIKHHFDIE